MTINSIFVLPKTITRSQMQRFLCIFAVQVPPNDYNNAVL